MTLRRDEFDRKDYGVFDLIRKKIGRTGRTHGRGSLLAFMVVLCMVAILVAVLWSGHSGKTSGGDVHTVPVIRADNQDFRAKPEDRGGMDVPHRDSTIFETIRESDSGGEKRVENLLDDDRNITEDRPRLFAGLKTEDKPPAKPKNLFDTGSKPVVEKKTTNAKAREIEERVASSEDIKDVSDETRSLVRSVLKEQEEKEAEEFSKVEPAAGAATGANLINKGNYFVQLVSVKSREAAAGAWPKLKDKYPSLTGNHYRVQAADLGERGTFYRLQAGPFDKATADKICGAIKGRKPGGCLVVRR